MEYTSSFPRTMFDAEGTSLDRTISGLTEERLVEYQQRSIMARNATAPFARVWLVSDDTTFAPVPAVIVVEAFKLLLAGKGVVVLARRLKAAVDVRDGLLDTLDGYTASQHAV